MPEHVFATVILIIKKFVMMNSIKEKSGPMTVVIGVFAVFSAIEIGRLGYNLGVLLKTYL